MSNATTKSVGMTLFSGAAGSPAATAIGGIKEITGMPKIVFDEYDNSWLDQTSKIKSFVMTLADGGTLGFKLAMQPATLTTFLALADGLDRAWKIGFSSGGAVSFEGPLKSCGMGEAGGTNTEVVVPIEVRVSKLPTYAPPP